MNDLFVGYLVQAFEMRNFERTHGLDRRIERGVCATVLSVRPSYGPQGPEDLRPIKPLPFTMLAEAHSVPCLGYSR